MKTWDWRLLFPQLLSGQWSIPIRDKGPLNPPQWDDPDSSAESAMRGTADSDLHMATWQQRSFFQSQRVLSLGLWQLIMPWELLRLKNKWPFFKVYVLVISKYGIKFDDSMSHCQEDTQQCGGWSLLVSLPLTWPARIFILTSFKAHGHFISSCFPVSMWGAFGIWHSALNYPPECHPVPLAACCTLHQGWLNAAAAGDRDWKQKWRGSSLHGVRANERSGESL